MNYPKFPLKETIVVDCQEDTDPGISNDEKNTDNNIDENYKKILSSIEEVLNSEDKIKQIMVKLPKCDYDKSERIEALLEMAGGIKYHDYIIAIKKRRRYGSTILLERDIDEIFVNNYNSEWLLAWNANLDIQLVLDYFAVITYVTDYWAKPDEGLTPYLKEAAENKSEPDQRKRCQEMANTFMTYRQMGEAEAYYKILPNLTLKYSSMDTIFVPSDKKELRSKFLMKLHEGDTNFPKGIEVKGGRDGLFLEKADIIDKYCRREIREDSGLEELRLSQFAKMYEPIRGKQVGGKEHGYFMDDPQKANSDDNDDFSDSDDE